MILFVLIVISCFWGERLKAGVHYYTFILFYSVCHFFYFVSKIYLLEQDLDNNEITVFYQALILYVSIISSYLILSYLNRKKYEVVDIHLEFKNKKLILSIFAFFYILGVCLYIVKNGISFSDDYNSRIEQNAGGGVAIILMYSYVPFILILYNYFSNKKGLYASLFFAITFGIIYYFLIGGSRNLLAAGVFAIIYMAIIKKHLSILKVIIFGVLGGVLLLSMEIFRYSNSLDDVFEYFNSGSFKNLSFIFESFSPMFAVLNINNAIESNMVGIQGLKTFFNEFGILVPRFLWPDKPLNVYNSGYFYTSEILKLNTNLTMSPTLLGSFIIMFGQGYYWFLGIVTGFIIYYFDYILRRGSNQFLKMSFLSSIGYLFFWVRDGFEVYCYVVIKFLIAIFLARILYSILISIIPMKSFNVN
ncbi:WzyE family oligosaccharide polymerase [Vibrio cholerae]|nr:WzyE family oligosaccharide polymerase [Vibrio cholerae]ELN7717705.1 WzyE family oligosaccharide polymerase [Vibrio cholerae]